MAASITNSNETLDSITTGLLIHEVGLSHHRPSTTPPPLPPPLLSEVSAFTCPSFLFSLIPDVFSAPAPITSLVSLSD